MSGWGEGSEPCVLVRMGDPGPWPRHLPDSHPEKTGGSELSCPWTGEHRDPTRPTQTPG